MSGHLILLFDCSSCTSTRKTLLAGDSLGFGLEAPRKFRNSAAGLIFIKTQRVATQIVRVGLRFDSEPRRTTL